MTKRCEDKAGQWARRVKKRVRRGKGSIRVALDIHGARIARAKDGNICRGKLREMILNQDLGFRRSVVDPFDGGGYELVVTLNDSFVVVETWPRHNGSRHYVKVLVDVCHYRRDNTMRALMIAAGIRTLFHQKGTRTRCLVTHHGP